MSIGMRGAMSISDLHVVRPGRQRCHSAPCCLLGPVSFASCGRTAMRPSDAHQGIHMRHLKKAGSSRRHANTAGRRFLAPADARPIRPCRRRSATRPPYRYACGRDRSRRGRFGGSAGLQAGRRMPPAARAAGTPAGNAGISNEKGLHDLLLAAQKRRMRLNDMLSFTHLPAWKCGFCCEMRRLWCEKGAKRGGA
jgi:hypothetical protein